MASRSSPVDFSNLLDSYCQQHWAKKEQFNHALNTEEPYGRWWVKKAGHLAALEGGWWCCPWTQLGWCVWTPQQSAVHLLVLDGGLCLFVSLTQRPDGIIVWGRVNMSLSVSTNRVCVCVCTHILYEIWWVSRHWWQEPNWWHGTVVIFQTRAMFEYLKKCIILLWENHWYDITGSVKGHWLKWTFLLSPSNTLKSVITSFREGREWRMRFLSNWTLPWLPSTVSSRHVSDQS